MQLQTEKRNSEYNGTMGQEILHKQFRSRTVLQENRQMASRTDEIFFFPNWLFENVMLHADLEDEGNVKLTSLTFAVK